MNDLLTTEELRRELTAHLDTVTPPPGDLGAVHRRGRRLRTRRLAGPGLLAAAAVGVGALVLSQTSAPAPDRGSTGPAPTGVVATDGQVDLSHGLRAYASPGERLYLGGTSLPLTEGMDYLDTDAVATRYGLVYTDPSGRPELLGELGRPEPLGPASKAPPGFHPTIKADAFRPVVVWATLHGQELTVTAYDLKVRKVVATTDITCSDDCSEFVIDGTDSGAVFLRNPKGTTVWNYDTGESFMLAGPRTRIADVRNKTVLFDGPAPSGRMDGWLFVPGPVDGELSHDGRYLLYWSDTLQPTVDGGAKPIKLDLPVKATFFTFDTDGSVLAATSGNPSRVFDCALATGTSTSSGSCHQIGEMATPHGDPMFIGNDM